MDRSRVGIVIPAFNEADSIGAVVAIAQQYGNVIVVDDGSTDRSSELAIAAGATLVKHERNRGYDTAINSGFAAASSLGCEVILTLDADGQHDPHLIEKFIVMMNCRADVVVGVRSEKQRMSEHIFAWYTKVRFGIHDPLCGMKAYRTAIYKELGHFDSHGSVGTELMIYAASHGYQIKQVPFQVRPRVGDSRFGRIFQSNCRILRALALSLFNMH